MTEYKSFTNSFGALHNRMDEIIRVYGWMRFPIVAGFLCFHHVYQSLTIDCGTVSESSVGRCASNGLLLSIQDAHALYLYYTDSDKSVVLHTSKN